MTPHECRMPNKEFFGHALGHYSGIRHSSFVIKSRV